MSILLVKLGYNLYFTINFRKDVEGNHCIKPAALDSEFKAIVELGLEDYEK